MTCSFGPEVSGEGGILAEGKPSSGRHPLHGVSLPADVTVLSDEAREALEQFRRAHETLVLTIFFSDLVGSTRLQTELGNLRAADLVQRHYGLMRRVLADFDGREIKTAGDSMLIVFAAPSEAVKFTLHAQRAMRREREAAPEFPPMRAGIHQGQVVLEMDRRRADVVDVYGLQVSTAARIMDLARGDQILLSRAVFDDARAILSTDDFPGFPPLAWRNHGLYRFKGVDDSHEVCEVGEEGLAALVPPGTSAKAWPAEEAVEELGWRPAAGVVVPESNWQLSEKLGEGAFGEVWKAYNLSDKSYQVFKFCFKRDRLPALKREARLLKRLRRYAHPAIVVVYDVTEGERPPHYLEMEYVDGPRLRDWLSADPPLSDRLEIVAQLADALDVVHAAGIYHRDIKPANILLTRREDGVLQAKLSDFGLGAAQDPEFLKSISDSHVSGCVGTWDYIAPELRHGGAASAQSDLYSLGLTLYQIVVGDLDRPLTGDWESQVPTEVLREDLGKCVCQDPVQRWASGAELARALRNHESRLHTRALELQRSRQQLRARRLRHAAILASVVALLLLAVSAVALYQWREAAWQRDRALAQKRLALEAISQLTHEVPLRLRNIPGTLPLAREILVENINMLDRILDLEPDTHYARRERAVNLTSIGDAWLLVGESQKALEAFENARQITEQLADTYPENHYYLRDLAIAWDRIGDVRMKLGQSPQALEAFEESMNICEELARVSPDERLARRDIWQALDKLGRMDLQLGKIEPAEKLFAEALAMAQALADEDPDDLNAQLDLGICFQRMGDLNMQQGRHAAALEAFERAMQPARRELTEHPENRDARLGMSIALDKRGSALVKLGRSAEARQAYEESLSIVQSLAAADPDNLTLRRDLSIGLDRLGDILIQAGDTEAALAKFEEAMSIAREIAQKDPLSASAQHDIYAGLAKTGSTYLRLIRIDQAEAAFAEALRIALRLSEADPQNVEFLRAVSISHCRLGDAYLFQERTDKAVEELTAATRVAERLVAADPANVQSLRDLAVCFHRSMLAYRQAGDKVNWLLMARRTIEQFKLVYDRTNGDISSKQDLINVMSYARDGVISMDTPTPDDLRMAEAWAEHLVELTDGLAPTHLQSLALIRFASRDGPWVIEFCGWAWHQLTTNALVTRLQDWGRQWLDKIATARSPSAQDSDPPNPADGDTGFM